MVGSTWASIGHFLDQPDSDIRWIITLERLHLKILKRKYSAVFNKSNIYIYIYIYTKDVWLNNKDTFCLLPFPKKADLGLAKNYRGMTLTSIAAKFYNALLRNRIVPQIDKIQIKNQNGFRRNRSTTSQILIIRRILEGVRAKTYRRHYYLSMLPRPSIPFTEERWNKSY